MENPNITIIKAMIYLIVGLIVSVVTIVFIYTYCISGPGFIALHEISHLILPANLTVIPIYRGEHLGSEVTQLVKDRTRIRIRLCLMPKTL